MIIKTRPDHHHHHYSSTKNLKNFNSPLTTLKRRFKGKPKNQKIKKSKPPQRETTQYIFQLTACNPPGMHAFHTQATFLQPRGTYPSLLLTEAPKSESRNKSGGDRPPHEMCVQAAATTTTHTQYCPPKLCDSATLQPTISTPPPQGC